MTMIICSKKDCLHVRKREDGECQCNCTAIGINQKGECDTYMKNILEFSQIPVSYRGGIGHPDDLKKRD